MGGMLSQARSYSSEPDAATGLSPRDKFLVAHSWGLAKKNVRDTGLHLFELFFKNEAIKDIFAFARGKDWSEFVTDPRLSAHINAVLYAITSLVDSIEDVAVLDAMIRKVADNHAARKITIREFEILGPVLLQTLSDKLGPRVMTRDATEAWTKVYGIILKIVEDQMRKQASE